MSKTKKPSPASQTPPACQTITTQTDIARMANVSQKTVHLALHGGQGVSPRTAERIQKLAIEHGYRLNAAASAMRSQSTRHIGLAVRPSPRGPLTHLSTYETILGADATLADAGYMTNLVRMTDISPDRNSRIFNEVLLDGIIVVDQLPTVFHAAVKSIAKHCVWAETDVWEPTLCIRRDELWAGTLAVEKVAEHGIQKVLWAGWPPFTNGRFVREHYSYPLRLQGVRNAAERHTIELTELTEAEMTDDHLIANLIDRLSQPGVAIVTYNSPTAMMLMNSLARQGFVAGKQYSLASCDGTRRDDVYLRELARVNFDRNELGKEAGRMMLASIQDRSQDCTSRLVRSSWIEGNTLVAPDKA